MKSIKKIFSSKTTLYVLLTILIIAAVILLLINVPVAEKTYTPQEVLTNSSDYLNKEIIVQGLFAENEIYSNKLKPDEYALKADISQVTNFTAEDDIKYNFRGILQKDPDDPYQLNVILIVEEITKI